MPTTTNKLGITRVDDAGSLTDNYGPFTYENESDGLIVPNKWIRPKFPAASYSNATGVSNNGIFVFEVEASFDLDDVEYRIDGGTWTPLVFGFGGSSVLDDGEHTLDIRGAESAYANADPLYIDPGEQGPTYTYYFTIHRVHTYGTKMRMEFEDLADGATWKINFKKKAYTDKIYEICGTGDAPAILQVGDGNSEDMYSPIVGSRLQINWVLERGLDGDALVDVLNDEIIGGNDRDWYVEVQRDGTRKFQGFLVPQGMQVPYSDRPQVVTLIATDGLAELRDVKALYGGDPLTAARWNDSNLRIANVFFELKRLFRFPDLITYKYFDQNYADGASASYPAVYQECIDANTFYVGIDDVHDGPTMYDLVSSLLKLKRLRMYFSEGTLYIDEVILKDGSQAIHIQTSSSAGSFSTSSETFEATYGDISSSPTHYAVNNDQMLEHRNSVRLVRLKHDYELISTIIENSFANKAYWSDDFLHKKDIWGWAVSDSADGDPAEWNWHIAFMVDIIRLTDSGDIKTFRKNLIMSNEIDNSLFPYPSYLFSQPVKWYRHPTAKQRLKLSFGLKQYASGTSPKISVLCGGYYMDSDGAWNELVLSGGGATTLADIQIQVPASGLDHDSFTFVSEEIPDTLNMAENHISIRFYIRKLGATENLPDILVNDVSCELEYYVENADDLSESIVDSTGTFEVNRLNNIDNRDPYMEWSWLWWAPSVEMPAMIKDIDGVRITDWYRPGEAAANITDIFIHQAAAEYNANRRIINGSFRKYSGFKTQVVFDGDNYLLQQQTIDLRQGIQTIRAVQLHDSVVWPV